MSQDAAIQRAVLRLRMTSPFFAALLMFAGIEAREGVGTAATDGRTIYYDPVFFSGLTNVEIEAVLMHEVLHCALQHPARRGVRDSALWNYAADIVVNGMISELAGYRLPMGAVRDSELERYSTEEVYQILQRRSALVPKEMVPDLLESAVSVAKKKDEAYWPQALRGARLIAAASGVRSRGEIPSGVDREIDAAGYAKLDWRTLLWRFLVRTPSDFSGFDRRFVHDGLYLDELAGEALTVNVAIDTSGSVTDREMAAFMAELGGILATYPHVRCRLFYADADLYGPYELCWGDDTPKPRGGGGTSFIPFFKAVEDLGSSTAEEPCVYLTDGYGTFPPNAPRQPTLWVVQPGGLESEKFPFGEVLRMIGT